jgi:ribonuclease III
MKLSDNKVVDQYSDENLRKLEKKLDIFVKNKELLRRAISSSGAKNEYPALIDEDNERLEFLGDSVYKFLLSEYLYREPDSEGKMTRLRIVREKNETLGRIAKGLDIKPHLFLSIGETKLEGKGETRLLADALEAIIGAIYLDEENINSVRTFMNNKIFDELEKILRLDDLSDSITPLQEICQKQHGKPPRYEYNQISGKSHNPIFKAEVYMNNEKIAEAEGGSKKQAREKVARKALNLLS